MAQFDESSNFNEALSNFHRLERPSCLGSALHQACFSELPFFCQKKSHLAFCLKITTWWIRRPPTNTTSSDKHVQRIRHLPTNPTSSDKYDVQIRRRPTNPTSFFCQGKKSHSSFCSFVLETLAFQSIKKVGTFFSTWKFIMNSNEFQCNLFAFLVVHFLNFNSFFIAFGRRMPALSTTKLHGQVIFFKVSIFAP